MATIKAPDFTRLIAELRTRVCINDVDAEAIEELLQDDYYIAISSARNEAYYEGHSDGYARGYDDGYDEGRIAKIIADVRARTCVDKIDAKAMEQLLQECYDDYCRTLDGY